MVCGSTKTGWTTRRICLGLKSLSRPAGLRRTPHENEHDIDHSGKHRAAPDASGRRHRDHPEHPEAALGGPVMSCGTPLPRFEPALGPEIERPFRDGKSNCLRTKAVRRRARRALSAELVRSHGRRAEPQRVCRFESLTNGVCVSTRLALTSRESGTASEVYQPPTCWSPVSVSAARPSQARWRHAWPQPNHSK